MALTLTFRDMLDLPDWHAMKPAPNASAIGVSLCADKRNDETRMPFVFELVSGSVLNRYNAKNDGWGFVANPGLLTTAAGTISTFCPSIGPKGTLAAGCTTTEIVLTTALPAAVGINQLANRGDGIGFRVRIIGNTATGNGLTEERTCVANTAGTTPSITITPALSNAPVSGDRYEFLAGSVMMLGSGAAAATSWRAYDLLTNLVIAKAYTNLPTVAIDSSIVCLDELYVPYGRVPGEGFFGVMTCANSAAGTLTGQPASPVSGDSAVLQNEFRNCQIRIVNDPTNPRAAGQRRRITSHTGGSGSPVYTLATSWTYTPTAGVATYVVELPNYILRWGEASGTVTYCYDTVADTWATNTFAAGGAVVLGTVAFGSWGIKQSLLDVGRRAKWTNIFRFRGTGLVMDVLDIAGGATGAWEAAAVYNGQQTAIGSGTTGEMVPFSQDGRYAYMMLNISNLCYRFDTLTRVMEDYAQLPAGIQGAVVIGDRMAALATINDGTTIGKVFYLPHTSSQLLALEILR
jgi:hypothetical protein